MKTKLLLCFLWLLIPAIQFAQTISDMLEKALPAVVTIAIYQSEDAKQILGFRGDPSDVIYEKYLDLTGAETSGSGFVIEKNGKKYVVTNAHVVADASITRGSLYIFSVTQKKYEMRVVGGDIIYDIALLEFVTPPGPEFSTLAFETAEPRIGEQVYAIGNPLAKFPYSVVDGIISAKNRTTTGMQGFQGKFGYIQSTATLIWGNSGGPLINSRGNVVGINSQLYAEQVGEATVITPQINFALESKVASRIIGDIINNNGNVIRAFIGVEISRRYRYVEQSYYYSQSGFVLADSLPVLSAVIEGSPAAGKLSGKIGWEVIKINNEVVRNTEEVLKEFEGIRPGQTVSFTLQKGYSVENISFPVQELNSQRSKLLAVHIFEKEQNININEGDDKVWVRLDENKGYGEPEGYSDKKYKLEYIEKAQSATMQEGDWQIVSAGINDENNKNLWFVHSLADLGVIARIMGSMGYLDLLVQKNGYYQDDLKATSIIFSNDSNIRQETIWY